jgi:hypothetical protein
VLADVAFLAMDLERLGAGTLAAQLLAWYREFSNEQHPETLAHYYVAHRALIRSKVACVRATQGDADAGATARLLLALAHGHVRRARVRLVLVGGAPGMGKSRGAGPVHLAHPTSRCGVAHRSRLGRRVRRQLVCLVRRLRRHVPERWRSRLPSSRW